MVGKNDTMTLARKVKIMFDKYGSKMKMFKVFKGDHVSQRPAKVLQNAAEFISQIWEIKKPKNYSEGFCKGFGIEESFVLEQVKYGEGQKNVQVTTNRLSSFKNSKKREKKTYLDNFLIV